MNNIVTEIDVANRSFAAKVALEKNVLLSFLGCKTRDDIHGCIESFVMKIEALRGLESFKTLPINPPKALSYLVEFLYELLKTGKEVLHVEMFYEINKKINKVYVVATTETNEFIRGHIWTNTLLNQMMAGDEGFCAEKDYKSISVEEFEELRKKIKNLIETFKLTKEEIYLLTGERSQGVFRATSNLGNKKKGFITAQKFYDKLVTGINNRG